MSSNAPNGPGPARAGAGRVLCARRLRADRTAGAAAGRAVSRPVRRGHPPAHVSHHRSGRPRIVPAARSDHSGVARLSGVAAGGEARGLLLSRRRVPPSRRRAGRIPAGRHRELRPRRQGGGRRRNARARARSDLAIRRRRARNPHRRRRTVRGLHRRARSRAGLEAPPDQGFQPQDLAQARPRPAHARRRQRFEGISGRARGARRLRSARPRIISSPICSRSPASPRSAAARSPRSPTVFSNNRRSMRRRGCRARRAR